MTPDEAEAVFYAAYREALQIHDGVVPLDQAMVRRGAWEAVLRWVELERCGYRGLREVPGQGLCATMGMAFTTGLFVRLSISGYERRYCYEHQEDAEASLAGWDGTGDPGGRWVKEKPGDRLGPGAFE